MAIDNSPDDQTKTEDDAIRSFRLLDRSCLNQDVTARDDHYEFPILLDSAKKCRQKGNRFRLVDSGQLKSDQLQWIASSGADIYTSDSAGRSVHDIVFINRACMDAKSFCSFFHHAQVKENDESNGYTYSQLEQIGGSGVYLHISNKEYNRDLESLNHLAYSCLSRGSWLVYYHHSPFSQECIHLAGSGSWVYLTEKSLANQDNSSLLIETIKAAAAVKTGVVFLVEDKIEVSWLWDIVKSGGFVIFKKKRFDFRSPYRAVEERAKQKKLDIRAYYLNTTALP